MKISNFRDYKVAKHQGLMCNSHFSAFATVDISILKWFFMPKIKSVSVAKSSAGYWMFVDSGKYCPGMQVECLERAYLARMAMETA